jgi:hypothetical protein
MKMLMRFEKAVSQLSRVDQGAVKAKIALLEKTTIGGLASGNFREELLMHDHEWRLVLNAILNANVSGAGAPGEKIQEEIRMAMRGVILQGKKATCPRSTIFVRAVTLEQLTTTLVGRGRFASPSAAQHHIRHMIAKPLKRAPVATSVGDAWSFAGGVPLDFAASVASWPVCRLLHYQSVRSTRLG